jgi:EamA domain-containing membrane protein RarD
MGLSIGVIINPLLMLIFGFLIIKEGLSKTTRDIPKQSLDRSVRE